MSTTALPSLADEIMSETLYTTYKQQQQLEGDVSQPSFIFLQGAFFLVQRKRRNTDMGMDRIRQVVALVLVLVVGLGRWSWSWSLVLVLVVGRWSLVFGLGRCSLFVFRCSLVLVVILEMKWFFRLCSSIFFCYALFYPLYFVSLCVSPLPSTSLA
jgi:hypothetical protein